MLFGVQIGRRYGVRTPIDTLAVFAETFEMLSGLADRVLRREGGEMLRLIDASPIPVDEFVSWAQWNGRTRGLKLHVVYDPAADQPLRMAITPATVNDVEVGQTVPTRPGQPTSTTRPIAVMPGGRGLPRQAPSSSPARRRMPATGRVAGGSSAKQKGTASPSSTMPRSGSSAKATLSSPFRCAASASSAMTGQK